MLRWFGAIGALFVVCIVLAPAPARALCVCTCSVAVAPVAFGNFNPLANATKNVTADVTVSCGPVGVLVTYDIRLSRGASGTYAARTMTSGAYTLPYNLYKDAGHTQVWGDGGGGSFVVSNGFTVGIGLTSRVDTIHARLPAAPAAHPGSYADTITATVVY